MRNYTTMHDFSSIRSIGTKPADAQESEPTTTRNADKNCDAGKETSTQAKPLAEDSRREDVLLVESLAMIHEHTASEQLKIDVARTIQALNQSDETDEFALEVLRNLQLELELDDTHLSAFTMPSVAVESANC